MISLKKYLDSDVARSVLQVEPGDRGILAAAIAAYRSVLLEMGLCSVDACPAIGDRLKLSLGKLSEGLSTDMNRDAVEATDKDVQEHLRDWGRRAVLHFRQQTSEVKGLLIVMARTAESVGERDQRCAEQIKEITTRLERIASLDDLTQIRESIEKSATELKTSVERMAAEGKAAIDQLRVEVSVYHAKLEEAEEISSRDALTGVRNRFFAEAQILRKIEVGCPYCAAILDIDGFKRVNDEHGHLVGDELLKQFATELQSACRSTDVMARWGGDEFIVLLDCGIEAARARMDRLREWVCGDYKIQGCSGIRNLYLSISIGLAEHIPGESMKAILDRADVAMYQNKAVSRAARNAPKR